MPVNRWGGTLDTPRPRPWTAPRFIRRGAGRPRERSVQVTQDVLQQAGIFKRRLPPAEFISTDALPI